MLSSFFVLSALLAAPVFAATPNVTLLTDLKKYPKTGAVSIKPLLTKVSKRKGSKFHFGSTYDVFSNQAVQTNFTDVVYSTVYNHMVAENGCKWYDTEKVRGVPSLDDCLGAQAYAQSMGNTFRGHNTFWHQQAPTWLPGNVTAPDLVNNVIPQHVKQTIKGLGNSVTSWDVMNELIGDATTMGMTALQCVQNKDAWPTVTADGGKTPLVQDLSFVHAAFKAAYQAAGKNTRLSYNDYSTGGNDAKTACVFALIDDIVAWAGVPYDRLAVGFQTHVTASTNGFPSKAAMAANFAKLADNGVQAFITELDIRTQSNSTADQRFQAAIWGDYLDACLYASNCDEFLNWDTRDDESWLGAAGAGTTYNTAGLPKIAIYELQARFTHYANNREQLCATSLGSAACDVTTIYNA